MEQGDEIIRILLLVSRIMEDKENQQQIGRIKSHAWVEEIERS